MEYLSRTEKCFGLCADVYTKMCVNTVSWIAEAKMINNAILQCVVRCCGVCTRIIVWWDGCLYPRPPHERTNEPTNQPTNQTNERQATSNKCTQHTRTPRTQTTHTCAGARAFAIITQQTGVCPRPDSTYQ